MHRLHNEPKMGGAPETSGSTIHWAGQYDLFTRLMGLGIDGPNSRIVVELAGIRPGEQVLDVGCGTGNLTLTARRVMRTQGAVYGIDASPEMIEVARRNAQRTGLDVTFEIGLVEQIPFPDGSFDAVINRLMVHHLPEDLKKRAFAEILRVLKPGGRLLITDFNPPKNPILAHLTTALVGHRMMQTDVRGLPGMLKAAGFIDVSSGPTRSSLLAYVRGIKPANLVP